MICESPGTPEMLTTPTGRHNRRDKPSAVGAASLLTFKWTSLRPGTGHRRMFHPAPYRRPSMRPSNVSPSSTLISTPVESYHFRLRLAPPSSEQRSAPARTSIGATTFAFRRTKCAFSCYSTKSPPLLSVRSGRRRPSPTRSFDVTSFPCVLRNTASYEKDPRVRPSHRIRIRSPSMPTLRVR